MTEAQLAKIIGDAGFSRFRRATETPLMAASNRGPDPLLAAGGRLVPTDDAAVASLPS